MKTLFAIKHPDNSEVEVTATLKGDNVELVEMLEVEVVEMPIVAEKMNKRYELLNLYGDKTPIFLMMAYGDWLIDKILKP